MLAELFFERDELQTVIKPNLEAIYHLKIGRFVLENFTLQIECRRLKREIDLAQSYLNRSEAPDKAAITAVLETEFVEWEKQIREMFASVLKSELRAACTLSVVESDALKSLYRSLVKKFHPDLTPT